MQAMIACDPHKFQVTVAVMSDRREVVAQAVFPTGRVGWREMGRFARRWPKRRWAVEGASGAGAALAQRLVATGEIVVDVPAKLAARVRLLSVGNGRKNDAADAISVGVAALDASGLAVVRLEGDEAMLRLLSDRRDDLVRQRTQAINRLHGLLAVLSPGHQLSRATASGAAELLRRRPRERPAQVRRRIALDIVAHIRALDRRIANINSSVEEAVKESRTTLVDLFGIGPVLAAKILGHSGDVRRFPTKDHFASYTGTAPIEASSGDVVRHRLSRAGNRQLNHALYIMAICQIRQPTPGQTYFRRKMAEGKSHKEALRCLKRRLSDAVFHQLEIDSEAAFHLAV